MHCGGIKLDNVFHHLIVCPPTARSCSGICIPVFQDPAAQWQKSMSVTQSHIPPCQQGCSHIQNLLWLICRYGRRSPAQLLVWISYLSETQQASPCILAVFFFSPSQVLSHRTRPGRLQRSIPLSQFTHLTNHFGASNQQA